MHVGVLHVRLHLPDARSLKDKRQVVRSILDRARSTYRVAAAEVDEQDIHRIAVLGFASVSNSRHHAEEVVQKILDGLRQHPAARLIEHELDVV
ncbi:MAG: DUF503 domain-containing protein [Planctomycetota bacterium]|nr:DUF503 domain-containing protein [Planctomycetota bacterium]